MGIESLLSEALTALTVAEIAEPEPVARSTRREVTKIVVRDEVSKRILRVEEVHRDIAEPVSTGTGKASAFEQNARRKDHTVGIEKSAAPVLRMVPPENWKAVTWHRKRAAESQDALSILHHVDRIKEYSVPVPPMAPRTVTKREAPGHESEITAEDLADVYASPAEVAKWKAARS